MNKIKGSSSAVKMKYLLFVFAAAVLVALPTRVYQLLALVDASNGFFKESDITVPVLYAILVIFGLLFIILSFISKEVPSPKLPTGKNPVLGVASFVVTAGFGWDMLRTLRDTIPINQGNVNIFMNLLKMNLAQKGGAFALLGFVFAFFSMVYFIVFGISHLNGKASYKEFKLLALSPLCWSMTALITKLMSPISFVKVSELLFEIFMFVFTMLFFLTFARISSGVFTEDSMWGIYGYGLTASLFAAIVTIPRIVISLVGLDAVENYAFDFSHLAVLIFVLAYVFASLGVGFKDGLKNRRTVSEIDLLDDFEIVTKKDDSSTFVDEEIAEIEETVENIIMDDIDSETENTVEEIAEIEETVENIIMDDINSETEDTVEEVEEVEETVENIIMDDIDSETEDIVEEVDETVEIIIVDDIDSETEDTVKDVEEVEETVEFIIVDDDSEIEDTVEDFEFTIEEADFDVIPEEMSEDITEDAAEEQTGEAIEESTEEKIEEKTDSEELKIVSLAELRKKKNQE